MTSFFLISGKELVLLHTFSVFLLLSSWANSNTAWERERNKETGERENWENKGYKRREKKWVPEIVKVAWTASLVMLVYIVCTLVRNRINSSCALFVLFYTFITLLFYFISYVSKRRVGLFIRTLLGKLKLMWKKGTS